MLIKSTTKIYYYEKDIPISNRYPINTIYALV